MKVAFCPTQEMIADFFTKPLQGSLFARMREKILNLPVSKIADVHRSVLEERGVEVTKMREHKQNKYKEKRNDGIYKQDSVTRMETRNGRDQGKNSGADLKRRTDRPSS